MRTIQEDSVRENGSVGSSGRPAHRTSEVIADLLDLEFELTSIQQGLHHMQSITPSDPFGPSAAKDATSGSDPFGDSFTPDTMFPPSKIAKFKPVAILPPPPSAKDASHSGDPFNVPPPARHPHRRNAVRVKQHSSETCRPAVVSTQPTSAPMAQQEKHWFDQETESLFDEGELISPPMSAATTATTTTATSAVSAITPKTDQVRHISRLTYQCLVTKSSVAQSS